jgi:hypothetical protein
VQPSPSQAPHCSVSPNSITSGSSATVTIKTTAPTAATQGLPSGIVYALWLPIAGLVLTGIHSRSRSPKRVQISGWRFGALLVVCLAFQSACGGGGNSGGGGGGTPPGTYTITVKGTSASLSHSTTVTLKVQ